MYLFRNMYTHIYVTRIERKISYESCNKCMKYVTKIERKSSYESEKEPGVTMGKAGRRKGKGAVIQL